jgi:dTDP-D-glucose 4,6-dehydratase
VTAASWRLSDKPWSLVRSVPDRPGHDRRYAMDGSQAGRARLAAARLAGSEQA